MNLSLDDQIEALVHTRRLIDVMARRCLSRGRKTDGLVDHAMGLDAVLRNLQFQKKHERRFKDLARQIVMAEQMAREDPAVKAVLEEFPGSEVVGVSALEEV